MVKHLHIVFLIDVNLSPQMWWQHKSWPTLSCVEKLRICFCQNVIHGSGTAVGCIDDKIFNCETKDRHRKNLPMLFLCPEGERVRTWAIFISRMRFVTVCNSLLYLPKVRRLRIIGSMPTHSIFCHQTAYWENKGLMSLLF